MGGGGGSHRAGSPAAGDAYNTNYVAANKVEVVSKVGRSVERKLWGFKV
jgi:hypothetical protein